MVKYIRMGFLGILLVFGLIMTLGSSNAYENKGIYYDNVSYTDNVTFYGVDGVNLDYSAEMNKVGDSYSLTFDVVNDSGVNVKITDTMIHQEDPYIHYELCYEDGTPIQIGDTLLKGESKRVQYTALYENPVMTDEYEVDSSFQIHFEQKFA